MFGGLKDKLGGDAIDKAVHKFAPALGEHLDKIKALKPADVNDNSKFESLIIAPMLLSVSAASGGITKLIPKFDMRFNQAMFHVRDELIVIKADSVELVADAQSKLPKVLIDGFKKSV